MHIPFGHILLFIAAGFIGYLQGHIASGVILMFVFQLGREVSQAELSIVPRWPEWANEQMVQGGCSCGGGRPTTLITWCGPLCVLQ